MPKGVLIPDETTTSAEVVRKGGVRKDLSLKDEPAAYQLVGGVTAHQGEDG
jgi:hypothetical protein